MLLTAREEVDLALSASLRNPRLQLQAGANAVRVGRQRVAVREAGAANMSEAVPPAAAPKLEEEQQADASVVEAKNDASAAVLQAAEELEELELPSSDSEPEDVMDMIAETFMTMKTDCSDCGVSCSRSIRLGLFTPLPMGVVGAVWVVLQFLIPLLRVAVSNAGGRRDEVVGHRWYAPRSP